MDPHKVEKCKGCHSNLLKRAANRIYKVLTLDHREIQLHHNGDKMTAICPHCESENTFSIKEIKLNAEYVLNTGQK